MIKILHISDFHYKKDHSNDYEDIVRKMCDSLQKQSIDIIVFSGDLVFEASNADILNNASDVLFTPLIKTLNLDNKRVIITPGNHDLKRGEEMPMVRNQLDSISTIKELDTFCQDQKQCKCSLDNFKNYNSFITTFYGSNNNSLLYYTDVINLHDTTIGVVSFNSAWRCTDSVKDRGNLLYPVYLVKEALSKVQKCDLIICNQHHNISDYRDYVAQDIEDEINEKCHILFTGHYHKASINTNHDAEVGLLHISAFASMNRWDKESKYGYSIIEIDESTYEGSVCHVRMVDGNFIDMPPKSFAIPVSEAKKEINDFRKLLRKRFEQTLQIADELFVSGNSGDFMKLFNNPIIKNKSVQEIIATQKEGEQVSLPQIISNDKSAIIFGYNKKGKTPLLRWIQIDSIKECLNRKVIPYYLDYKLYKAKTFDLKKVLRNYLEINTKKCESFFNEYSLLLLVDDLNPTDNNFTNLLVTQLKMFPHARFVATCAESISKQCSLINFQDYAIEKFYIHDITYREVHQLTLSWPNISVEKKKKAEEKIIQIFTQMHIPLNYWTTSLFLWIFEKTDEHNIHNNFDLIQLYIDELLDKKNYILNPDNKVSYDDLKSYLSALAQHILMNNYAIDESELIQFTEKYRNDHKKFTDTSWDIIRYLLEKAILIKSDTKFTIRLKGVFEFFLAYRMKENEKFKNDVLTFKNYILSFGNELELYAGFCKDDEKTISEVFDSAKKILYPITSKADYENLDSHLSNQLKITSSDFKHTGNLLNKLAEMPNDEGDGFDYLPVSISSIDETEVKPKRLYDQIDIDAAIVERIIFVLARVYRNSNACDMLKIADEMFEYILNGSCYLGFMLVEDSKSFDNNKENETEALVSLVSNFIPIIIEAFFYDAICQQNLTRVFESKLKDLMNNPKGNEMRIFMLTYILVDLDIKQNMPLIDKALQVIKNKILRFAMLNKNLLLTMKYYDNPIILDKLKVQRQIQANEFKEFDGSDQKISQKLIAKNTKEQHVKTTNRMDYK